MKKRFANNAPSDYGPSFAAPALWGSDANPGYPLTAEERALLALIATIVRYRKGDRIYQEGADATAAYNIVAGVVKSYRDLPDSRQHIVGFLFAGDLLGLAENGKYVNSAAAVTAATLHRIPAGALEARLRKNPTLDFHIISKLCHDLREAQRHAFVLSRHRATVKLALFLEMIEAQQDGHGLGNRELYLPMSRSDIGAYVGISPEAVSRALRDLVSLGAITFRDRRHVKISNRAELEGVISESLNPR